MKYHFCKKCKKRYKHTKENCNYSTELKMCLPCSYKIKLSTIKDAVEFHREQHGWTKTKMAKELHIMLSNYSDFLAGRRGLPIIAIKYAYRIGIPAKILLQIN